MRGRAEELDFRRRGGGGDPKVRDVERRAHGQARKRELESALQSSDQARDQLGPSLREELESKGVVVVLEGGSATYPLQVDALERMSRHRRVARRPYWLLLSASSATDRAPERAMVWISDEYRPQFLRLFEDFLEKETPNGHPRRRELIANIGRIRGAVVADLWQSDGEPPTDGEHWWELWLRQTEGALEAMQKYAAAQGATLVNRRLALSDRIVVWVRTDWEQLQALPFTDVPLAEIRVPEFVDTVEDLSSGEQDSLTEDLAERVRAADQPAPAVCHLDTGVRRSHALLESSLADSDMHTIVAGPVDDRQNHGTLMAGLALYGSLDELLLGSQEIRLRHRLESVKMIPDGGAGHDPLAFGMATASAIAMPEVAATRPRVFCLPITSTPDRAGEPSLWSASIDALAAGVDIARDEDGIELLSAPNPDATRLILVSTGNVAGEDLQADYRAACDSSAIEDPAHAWNALTVGASTELVQTPSDPSFHGWQALAELGDISPHSRTSLLFGQRVWPLKPEICMEGGNVLTDGAADFHEAHPLLCCRTTDAKHDLAIGSANATSAATAQAARLAALAQAQYPDYWPETLRALLVHAAEWTPVMRAELDGAASKTERLALLRRYGWGVPDESSVLNSSRDAVTLVTQDEFVPFEGDEHAARHFRLHRLPWPQAILRELGDASVTLRVTLSYYIEPAAARRGWRRRYSYPSHGLRFELKAPTESTDQFIRRVNREAQAEEDEGGQRPSGGSERWLVGPNQRNLGSLHQDVWEGPGVDLADAGVLAVHPVGGWWKNGKRADRKELPVRYALLVSLRTAEQDVDLYSPIAIELGIPVETAIAAA